jgi:hypothetical protein
MPGGAKISPLGLNTFMSLGPAPMPYSERAVQRKGLLLLITPEATWVPTPSSLVLPARQKDLLL